MGEDVTTGEAEPQIRPQSRVIRVIKPDAIVLLDEGGRRPASSQFSDSSHDNAMSVFVEDLIIAAGKNPGELLEKFPGCYMSWMYASDYEEEGQVITLDPQDSFFPGHAAVSDLRGKRSARTKTRLAQRSRWWDSGQRQVTQPQDHQ